MTDQEQNQGSQEAQDEFDGADEANMTDGQRAAHNTSDEDLKPGQSRAALRGIPAGPDEHPRSKGRTHPEHRTAEDDQKDADARDAANKKAHDAGLA